MGRADELRNIDIEAEVAAHGWTQKMAEHTHAVEVHRMSPPASEICLRAQRLAHKAVINPNVKYVCETTKAAENTKQRTSGKDKK